MSNMRHFLHILNETIEEAGIDGLPDHIKLSDPLLDALRTRGGHTIVAKPGRASGFTDYPNYTLEFHPNGGTRFDRCRNDTRKRASYYDPKLADLELDDEEFVRTKVNLKPHLTKTIEPLAGENIIYRGMSVEGYADFVKTGKVESLGHYNLAGQDGLTYWTTQIHTAAYYATNFAPTEHAPTFVHPAYVIAAKRPKDTRHVPGVGEHEVGVTRPILANEILALWRGTVYHADPGEMDFNVSWHDEKYKQGSVSFPGVSVAWERIG